MAGVQIQVQGDFTVQVDDQITGQLAAIIERMDHPERLYRDIADLLLTSTRERFLSETGPDGQPWAPLSPKYLASKRKRKSSFPGAIGRLHGYLMGQLHYESDADHATVGSNQVYAAMFQFGDPDSVLLGVGNLAFPARPFLGISATDREEILGAARAYITGE